MNDTNMFEPATKADLKELAQTTKADLKELEHKLGLKIDSVDQKLGLKIDSVDQKLGLKIDSVDQKLGLKIDSVDQELGLKIDSIGTRVSKLEDITKNIAVELTKTQADVREIKYDMATKMSTKDDISRVLNAIDKLAAVTENYKRKDLER